MPQAKTCPSRSTAAQCDSPQAISRKRHSFSAITRAGRPLHQRSEPECGFPLAKPLESRCFSADNAETIVGGPTPSCPNWFDPKAKIVPRRTSCRSLAMLPSGFNMSRCRSEVLRGQAVMFSVLKVGMRLRGKLEPSLPQFSESCTCHHAHRPLSVHKQASFAQRNLLISSSSRTAWRPCHCELGKLAGGPQVNGHTAAYCNTSDRK
mmetsp:Transcript_97453/g.168826  ORF Transcript_97453/g.168826 Transcript_97453/m.168826 type:complete len:207 (-) Transcript_97453:744-1364(-)